MTLKWRWIQLGTVACALILGRAEPLAQLPPSPAAAIDTAGVAVLAISGLWDATFALEAATQMPERATARTVRGRLQFSPVGDASPATASARSVHGGTFSIDFSRFGFTLSTQEALGWSMNPDSIRAVLNPTVDHGQVELHGRLEGDSVAVGTWRYTSDPGRASGTFRLQRVQNR